MGSLVPASGAGGLAQKARVLHRGGIDGQRIAPRSVAFFLIKSGVNFLAVALLGTALAVGLFGPELSLWLTAFQAFGLSPPPTVVLMGYLIGQLGGLLPLPGGIGGIDGGLIATLIVYGTPAAGPPPCSAIA